MEVNENGLRQIRDVLIRYSQYGSAYEVFDKHDIGLRQFASTVESQLRAGHPLPSISKPMKQNQAMQKRMRFLDKVLIFCNKETDHVRRT